MIKVLFVCHGNICRSTMAEFIMKHHAKQRGEALSFDIDSAGVSREEIGNDTHYSTKQVLREKGIAFLPRCARQIDKHDYDYYDYIIYMDNSNLNYLNRMFKNDPDKKFYKMMSFAGSNEDVADPWYTGDAFAAYNYINQAISGFFEYLKKEGKI